ncbi:MAG: MotA/TolQ/ExbB proton channel family protein [Acidimicrobiia bacterium]|jgi:chemotaxis protein MotA
MTTYGGIIVAIMAIVISTIMDGNSFGALIGPSSLVLVILGTVGVSFTGFQLKDIKPVPKGILLSFTGKEPDPSDAIDRLMKFAEIARKEGVLALEEQLETLDDLFMKLGLQQVVDGVDGDLVREVMEIELAALEERHAPVISFLKAMGGYAPTMGMLGTVVGLINMLGNLSDPEQLGIGMSLALLTTLYGVVFANLVFLPIAMKLQRLHDLEMAQKDLVMDGILAVQGGASPRMVVERLEAYINPSQRLGHHERSKRVSGKAA